MRYPPFKWHGGKNPVAGEIVALMDGIEHLTYLEPYFGAGSVLLAKDPAKTSEIANDIYSHLFDFFSVLRDQDRYQELIRLCQLTPFSEQTWSTARDLLQQEDNCQIKRAYAFYVSVQQSRQGLQQDFATPTFKRLRGNRNAEVNAYMSAVDRLPEYHQRLTNVMFFNRDATAMIESQDCDSRLIYADPPYIRGTRTSKDAYAHEMNDQDHHNLVDVFLSSKSKIMLSGYPGSETIYRRLEEAGWGVWERNVAKHSSSRSTKPRTFELIWANCDLNTTSAKKWAQRKSTRSHLSGFGAESSNPQTKRTVPGPTPIPSPEPLGHDSLSISGTKGGQTAPVPCPLPSSFPVPAKPPQPWLQLKPLLQRTPVAPK
jgi:DNA adenine methylase